MVYLHLLIYFLNLINNSLMLRKLKHFWNNVNVIGLTSFSSNATFCNGQITYGTATFSNYLITNGPFISASNSTLCNNVTILGSTSFFSNTIFNAPTFYNAPLSLCNLLSK